MSKSDNESFWNSIEGALEVCQRKVSRRPKNHQYKHLGAFETYQWERRPRRKGMSSGVSWSLDDEIARLPNSHELHCGVAFLISKARDQTLMFRRHLNFLSGISTPRYRDIGRHPCAYMCSYVLTLSLKTSLWMMNVTRILKHLVSMNPRFLKQRELALIAVHNFIYIYRSP